MTVTRRCTQRQFLMRPDKATNNAFVYCLADAAQRTGVQVILPQMEATHHHTAVHDREGRHPGTCTKMMAKSQNALRGRWENFWSSEEPANVEVESPEDLMRQLVYIATNPVKDNLVDRVDHWPGPNFLNALLTGKPMQATRPRHFFRADGSMPEVLTLKLELPDYIEHKPTFLAELKVRIKQVEQECARKRVAANRRVFGRRRILRQSCAITQPRGGDRLRGPRRPRRRRGRQPRRARCTLA